VVANLVAPVRFGFDWLSASDTQGLARAFKSFVDGGMDKAEAAGVTGMAESSYPATGSTGAGTL